MSTAASTVTMSATSPAAPRTRAEAAPRLRLTRRGRRLFTGLAAAPFVIGAFVFAINGGGATASLEGSDVPFEYVTVQSGQSLWEIAETVAPNDDPRDVISGLVSLNQLDSVDIAAGQELALPPQYTR